MRHPVATPLHAMSHPILRLAGHAGAAVLVATLAACGGGGADSSEAAAGALRIALTDSQACNYRSVFVTVTQVGVHRSAAAGEADPGWEMLTLSPPLQVDLMQLRNGVARELGTLPLQAGNYSQVRLVLAGNGTSPPYANYHVLPGAPSTPIALRTPSAQQSGLKLNVQATIEPGRVADLTLDFDPCKSVVRAGNSGNYNLKPVVTATLDLVNTAEGYTVPGALVSAQQGGTSVKSTVADPSGRFVLWPIATGTYDLVITAPGDATAVLEGVIVGDGVNAVSAPGTPLRPPQPSASEPVRQLGGRVMVTGASDVYADVRALQTLDGTKTIEVAAQPTDTDGKYLFTLPTAAPGRATWAAGTRAYTFEDVASAAGLYRVEARAAGFATPQVRPAPPGTYDLKLGDVGDADFSFGR